MTQDLLAQMKPEPAHDRFGRYRLPELLPGLETGREIPHTRGTTWAKTLSDMFGLAAWQCRMVAKGVASRPDLYALAAATPVDNKSVFTKLVEDAKEAGGASSARNQGSALHSFTEPVDRGEHVNVPPPWDQDIAAYQATLREAGISAEPHHIERVVVVPELKVAGRLDRIFHVPGVGRVIGDVKTGRDLSYSWGEISIQLALYAHASGMWNGSGYEPMPDVHLDYGLVVHLPATAATCTLYWVDLKAGWEAAQLCGTVRAWRTRKDLATKYDTDIKTSRDDLRARVESATSVSELYTLWDKADSEGVWNPDLTQAAAKRKQQLTQ